MTLVTVQEATRWASSNVKKDISTSNISYLVQYGKLRRFNRNGSILINIDDLKRYYNFYRKSMQSEWTKKLGNDLNWELSFDNLREKDTTKHIHRLHPYKGKFIPQLVEYFLDSHTDKFKKDIYFKKGDIILDPFLGSGTAIIQGSELGIHSIGIDISRFNCMIAECKMANYDQEYLNKKINELFNLINEFEVNSKLQIFNSELLSELARFNNKNFSNSTYKYKIYNQKINEAKYAKGKEEEFLPIYRNLLKKYKIDLRQKTNNSFLDKWYITNVRKEIDFVFKNLRKEKDLNAKKLLALILSRTIRSCRATTHSDLATLKQPQFTTYYCFKHKKICKPVFSIKQMLGRYSLDTLNRINKFKKIKSNSYYSIISGDSRKVDILGQVKKQNQSFYNLLNGKKVKGIFSSPPYVGQIDYHEQHAYAYDLLGFSRKDNSEIGPLYKGQGLEARLSYVDGIVNVLNNCKKYLVKSFDVFLVANDKYNLYPTIAEKSGMKIVN